MRQNFSRVSCAMFCCKSTVGIVGFLRMFPRRARTGTYCTHVCIHIPFNDRLKSSHVRTCVPISSTTCINVRTRSIPESFPISILIYWKIVPPCLHCTFSSKVNFLAPFHESGQSKNLSKSSRMTISRTLCFRSLLHQNVKQDMRKRRRH